MAGKGVSGWKVDVVAGIGLAGAGGLIAWLNLTEFFIDSEATNRLVLGIGGLIVVLVGFSMIPFGMVRFKGIRVESKSLKRLKLPSGWDLETSVRCPFGDCDALITDPIGKRTVVEIKSYEGLKKKWWFGTKIVKAKTNKKPDKDPVAQVKRNQSYFNAQDAIVWCPQSKENKIFTHDDVIFVNGDDRTLKRALNADAWGFFSRAAKNALQPISKQ